jgi:hypothetical protein
MLRKRAFGADDAGGARARKDADANFSQHSRSFGAKSDSDRRRAKVSTYRQSASYEPGLGLKDSLIFISAYVPRRRFAAGLIVTIFSASSSACSTFL